MNRLCLSAALLFLLVILVDSTPLNTHHVQDEGLETSHRRGPEKHSTKNTIKSIIRGAKIASAGSGLINEVIKAIRKGNKGHVTVSGTKYKNHTAEESPTLNIQQLILSEKNKDNLKQEASQDLFQTPPDLCQLPQARGPCKAALLRYFYNSTSNACEPFTYGGCQGNDNNFETTEMCFRICQPPGLHDEPECSSCPAGTMAWRSVEGVEIQGILAS
ncbi:hypothetical protein MJG53_012052 [Ovis ammon polii x Ovis aries]|uniref:BPTI/Kunitz inhibitor domain-containing protein n=2 Tax=Ovis TaxID=9935 RepID=A0A835ZWV9_SHEEP|nr:hypothetical protein JEQ12_004682 [Ovis aries]KAI4575849.1 hypothetical protein MJG53_012052 [Ovis ammon polii x Ovis aries]